MTLELELPEPPDPRGAAGLGARRRRPGARRSWLVTWTLRLLAALLAIVVAVPLMIGVRIWYQARQDEHPRSDAIVVLGAAQYNGVPSPTLRWRLDHAAKLFHEGVAPDVVTVGGKRAGDRYTEAAAGRHWLIEHGVPASRILAVPVGSDTLQSIRAVGRGFRRHKWKSAVIVTDPWHALRSKRMAEDNGIKAAASPTRSGPSVQTRDTQFRYIVRETGGYLWYVTVVRFTGQD